MFANTNFPVIRFSIESGDTLLIYTDGMTEARNAAGEEYGMHRVKAVANAQRKCGPADLLSHCLSDLGDFHWRNQADRRSNGSRCPARLLGIAPAR